ncbi:hypothetical protein HII17_06605 [Thalassotalea sp. M1531]|uniref:Uncharacterized protein n=1 Tax=Thalassotalea algicola TaxID=2716224 RepID=A0A7Y0LB79_9GAMM|nr:hypothetical protein [Thalassotalea algicola]NMP31226.1 hypothetical protein [Thalassotalea algicola]
MINSPVKRTNNKVVDTKSTNERKTPVNAYLKQKRARINKNFFQESNLWNGIDRRNGDERRKNNNIKTKRLDARCKRDRRASKLSITV